MRILFAGTPDFSVPALQALLDSGNAPVSVLTQPDRPSGRGRKLQASPVKRLAAGQGIPVLQPETLRTAEARTLLSELHADLMVVVAYGLILPQGILDLPAHGCWNIHASLLPRWRGAAPIQRAIEAGDNESGVCIMQMEAGLDTGPVLHHESTVVAATETGGSLHDRLAVLGAKALIDCVQRLQQDKPLHAVPQDETGARYARKLNKTEAQLDWTQPAVLLERRVRAFDPWPVAWCELGDERLRVWQASVADQASTALPESILSANQYGIDVATADGVLRLLEVQRPGGRRMPVADYLNAHSLSGL